MLDMYTAYYNECGLKERYSTLQDVNLDELSFPDVMYISIENEKCEKLFIFGIAGRANIFENNVLDPIRHIVLKGGPWVSILTYAENAGIYIETEANVCMLVNIIKENEGKSISEIRRKVNKFCLKNDIHNYYNDMIYPN